ncbi:MAG TPA: malto-oligosyltrehalose synthase [Flavipsychrobacter sp.]|nr:malto-oligosyltrehalose synthase [Flavipsychrobacter sp.]
MQYPIATYRIQFHKGFTFEHFERILLYLKGLGVTTIYASPILQAVPGSTHGYDGTNPHRINPEIGSEQQLRHIDAKLRDAGMTWLQDIVPNHMAYHPCNRWLMDVMEKGSESEYASFFDIDWDSPTYGGKLMAPFLGSSLEEVATNRELKVLVENDKTVLKYYDTAFPVNQPSLDFIHQLHFDWNEALQILNNSPDLLVQCAELQYYRLCHWQETDNRITYRRFFTINGLICLNVQDEKVFKAYHSYIKQLTEEGIFTGLRIDHIDGLYEPTTYLARLKELVGDKYVVVEKILQAEEELPESWRCEGTTGYDFLAIVNNLFTNRKAEEKFTDFYREITGNNQPIQQQIREKKAYILRHHMKGELENLCRLFMESRFVDTTGASDATLNETIAELLIECPVYRFYGEELPLTAQEEEAVAAVLDTIENKKPELAKGVALLREAMLTRPKNADEAYLRKAAHFYKRCMQYSGPLTAKGVEDTLMYTYNRFIAHNDVGDSPEAFGYTVEAVHQKMLERQKQWHLAINTASTHDTKRGEDVRARLNVLADIPDEWIKAVKQWQVLNADLKVNGAPDTNDEYFIYQTMVGAYPLEESDASDFAARMQMYLEKVLREAKIHSNWTAPNEAYENATKQFVIALLDKNRPFWNSFHVFLDKMGDAGVINALSQLLVKFTCPGIPDVYQGTELWDLSLVDPDNRRAVDYEKRERFLEEIQGIREPGMFSELWKCRANGKIKLALTRRLLQERRSNEAVFSEGAYIPLKVDGKYREHIFAFARRYKDEWIIVAVPLHIAMLTAQQPRPVNNLDWHNTRILLRPEMPADFIHLLSGEKGKTDSAIFINDIFKYLPLALLKIKLPATDRGAGILLSVTSLPSPFGVGDLGKEAYNFVRFLSRSKQKYWQILPLNPTESAAAHSPYSSYSSMAGNPLLISPELLAEAGLIDDEVLQSYMAEPTDTADYFHAEQMKQKIFDTAYEASAGRNFAALQQEFRDFCIKEAYWLEDMALYKVLKDGHEGKAWHQWERQFRLREEQALQQYASENADAMNKIKWLQFIFYRQWKALKAFANARNVQLFGDMPFYVSYDSADVWSHKELFCLDEDGNMTGVAGVPPDYFSETGQLWGMPTFNWHKLQEQHYEWWVRRLKKNIELFDLLRIDHFRALQDYWQVPADEETAINGKWLPGPRKEFFDVMKQQLGKLPFVAEDLGDKMEAVYELRDQVGLPGMKVLQFAWGKNMPQSVDIPHNHQVNSIVYTGTHDNNTTIGWYEEETNKADHKRMHHYLGLKVKQKNIHHVLARVAYGSVAKIAILPMQDVLGLGAAYRMNTPGKSEGNWLWRLKPHSLSEDIEKMLRDWVETYGR